MTKYIVKFEAYQEMFIDNADDEFEAKHIAIRELEKMLGEYIENGESLSNFFVIKAEIDE